MMDGVQVILSVEDSLSAMALTDEKGHFRIDGLKEGCLLYTSPSPRD